MIVAVMVVCIVPLNPWLVREFLGYEDVGFWIDGWLYGCGYMDGYG